MTAAFVAAFSLGEQIKTVGAYAGLAAILGLAVLTMLYVGQAREVKRLRDWVGHEPELALERERTLAEVSRITPPGASAADETGAGAAAPAAAGNGTAAAAESSGAGSSAPAAVPAAAAASRGSAVAAAPAASAPAKAAGAAKSPAGKGAAGGAAASTGPAASAAASAGTAESKAPAPSAAPEGSEAPAGPGESKPTAATAGPGGAKAPASAGPGSGPAGASAGPVRSAAPSAGTGPGASSSAKGPAAAGGSGATVPPAADGGLFGAHRTSAIAGGGAAFAVAAIVVATQLFGGSDEKRSANRIVPSPAGVKRASRSPSATAAPVERSGVTVTVLNGTTTTGLARGAANRLQANGYTIGQVTNAADQSRPSTSVSYARGFRRLGLDVARLLRVNSRSVHPMDAATRVVAGEDAMIVVTVGADQSP